MVGIGPKKPRSRRGTSFLSSYLHAADRVGSFADVPQNLIEHIKTFEDLFTVDGGKLKQVSDHFVKELEKGKSDHYPASTSLTNSRSQRPRRQYRKPLHPKLD